MGAWAVAIPVALWAIDKLTGGSMSGSSAISDAMKKMGGSIDKATGTIKDATDKAMGFNQPYMNPEVFRRLSDLVTSGAFQQPFGKSYQAPQWNTPNLTMNPSMGAFSMMPWSPGQPPPSFTPQGLPAGMAQLIQRPVPQQPPVMPPAKPPGQTFGPTPPSQVPKAVDLSKGLPPIPPPNFGQFGLKTPQSNVNQFRPFNPLTDRTPITRPGSGPFVPGVASPTTGPTMPTFGAPTWAGSGPMSPTDLVMMNMLLGNRRVA